MIPLQVGQAAPEFSLLDQDESNHALADYHGKWVVLYFYPKDDTPGCTTQACDLRDNLSDLNQLHTEVLGVSVDSVRSHKKFADKYHLSFPLLADMQKQVVEQYGVWGEKSFMGKHYWGINRTTFVIDPSGIIAAIYDNVNPKLHFSQLWKDLPRVQDGWLTGKH